MFLKISYDDIKFCVMDYIFTLSTLDVPQTTRNSRIVGSTFINTFLVDVAK